MKNRRRFLSIFLIALMLLSATPVMAAAAPTVTLTSPTATSIPAVTTAAAFSVDSEVTPYANIVFTLQFGGITNIYDVDQNNIKFYKADETSSSALSIAISGTSLDTTNSRYLATSTTPVTVTVALADLTADTDYVLYLSGAGIGNKNNDNNLQKDVYYYISTDNSTAPDTTAPAWSSGTVEAAKTNNSITLTWTAATDNVGVSYYMINQDGADVATTAALSYTAAGLSTGQNYNFEITAFDAAGNESATGLSITEDVNFEGIFLGRNAGVAVNTSLNVLLDGTANAATFSAIATKAELTTTGATPVNVPVTVTLAGSGKVVHVVPQTALSYGTEYELTVSGAIARTDGVLLSGDTSYTFRTIDLAAPTLQIVDNATSAAAVTLTAGHTYTITAALANTQDSAVTAVVMLISRSGKGTLDAYGGDASLQKQTVTVAADGTQTAVFSYTVPSNDSESVCFDLYTMNVAENAFLSSALHTPFSVE